MVMIKKSSKKVVIDYVSLAQRVQMEADRADSDEKTFKQLMALAAKLNVEEQVKLMDVVKSQVDVASSKHAKLHAFHSAMAYSITPTAFEEADIQSIKVLGVGTAYLSDDVRVSVVKGETDSATTRIREKAYKWLESNELGDLIQETVNASSLQAAIKGILEKNRDIQLKIDQAKWLKTKPPKDSKKDIPASLFAVVPSVRVTIKKR